MFEKLKVEIAKLKIELRELHEELEKVDANGANDQVQIKIKITALVKRLETLESWFQ